MIAPSRAPLVDKDPENGSTESTENTDMNEKQEWLPWNKQRRNKQSCLGREKGIQWAGYTGCHRGRFAARGCKGIGMIIFQNEAVTVFQSALQMTTSTVVETDSAIFVADPCWLPAEVEEIRRWVSQHRNGRPLFVLFTHSDFDHIVGYGAFREGKVVASKFFKDNPGKHHIIDQIRDWDNQQYIRRPYEPQFPRVDYVIDHNDQKETFADEIVSFRFARGHNPDGMFTLFHEQGLLLAGDFLSDFELPLVNHSLEEYQTSLARARDWITSLKVKMLVPGHGAPTMDVQEMLCRIETAGDYLRRLEKAVRAADPDGLKALGEEFVFPSKFTREGHAANVRVIRRELGLPDPESPE
jgi:glyoxylase-like metal-dependent hydrolase (beta-lactamase superfamily II)